MHPSLDLHFLSVGAAETAVRWWLEERVPGMCAPSELNIVTGYGKTRKARQTSDVRARVVRLLRDMNVPATIAANNHGMVLVENRAVSV